MVGFSYRSSWGRLLVGQQIIFGGAEESGKSELCQAGELAVRTAKFTGARTMLCRRKLAQEIYGAGGRAAKAFQDERHQVLGGVLLRAVAGLLVVNVSRGRAAWLARASAKFGDVDGVRINKADADVQHAAR